ncbi:MAG: hypothetical protein P8R04_05960 [Gammaproteobacteria bacterium]|nr:hypothetical protein [Gammaproteobacteria bacterium]
MTNTGVFVVEGLLRDQSIPVHREAVTAFVGPAPRGPVDRPIQINGFDQYRRVFGAPDCHSRLEHLARQFFANGGDSVWIVRIASSSRCNYIEIPSPSGALVLHALNPGPLENLRASVDFDGISAHEPGYFNLVVQRLRSSSEPLVEEQEIYRKVSINKSDARYVGYALAPSHLVKVPKQVPEEVPLATVRGDAMKVVSYIDCEVDWPSNSIPDDYDLIGSDAKSTGLFALKTLSDLDFLCLLSGADDTDLGPVALLAGERYCNARQTLMMVDPPVAWRTPGDVIASQGSMRLGSENVMSYFPLLRHRAESGELMRVSAMGAIASGLVASHRGIAASHDKNAVTIRGRYRPAVDVTAEQSALLARFGINTLMPASRLQMKFCGNVTMARTGGLTGEWKALTHRREGLFVVGSIRKSTTWAAREESTPELWAEISEQVREFLSKLRAEGRLAGELDDEAFYIKCDATTNNGSAGKQGDLTLLAGFAFNEPNEFTTFKFHRSGAKCDITELGWQHGRTHYN